MGKKQQADVFLRGTRTYVQGTQIVARAAELVEGGPAVFTGCKFTAITRNMVSFGTEGADGSIGSVTFGNEGGTESLFHVFDDETPAPGNDTPLDATVSLREIAEDGTSSDFEIVCETSFESRLNALVQAVKEHQDRAYENVYDNWFTGLRRIVMPVAPGDTSGTLHGHVCIRLLRRFETGAAQNAMYAVQTTFDDPDQAWAQVDGIVTFSYKQRG